MANTGNRLDVGTGVAGPLDRIHMGTIRSEDRENRAVSSINAAIIAVFMFLFLRVQSRAVCEAHCIEQRITEIRDTNEPRCRDRKCVDRVDDD